MEVQLNQILPQVVEMQELTNYSKKLNETLAYEESKVLEVKYKSEPFGKMDALKVITQSSILLFKINVITGWEIPTEETQTILVEQLCKKLVEAYPTVNPDEVEYAFRNRNTEIKNWGKSFNLTLFDEVMTSYMEERFEISNIEQQIKSKPLELEEKKETTDEEMNEWVCDWFERVKKIQNPIFIPHGFFEWLEKKEILVLTKEQKQDYLYTQAVTLRHFILSEQVRQEGEHSAMKVELENFNEMRILGVFHGREVIKLKNLAKQIAVFDYLKNESNKPK